MTKILLLLIGISVLSCRSNVDMHVSSGNLDVYSDFPSSYVKPRTIRVWTPSDYDPANKYEVLYMHDGQMLYDSNTTWNGQEWGVDEALDSLMSLGRLRPCIVVGIDNTIRRMGEYCPDDIAQYLPSGKSIYKLLKPRGNDYLRFLVEEVKPFIDSVYSTYTDASHTWIMGSSCGGLISSYALCKYPDVFGGAVCMSTHCTLGFPNPSKADSVVVGAYRSYLAQHLPAPNSRLLYMDDGDSTLDAYYLVIQNSINDALFDKGWDCQHFVYRFFPDASHTENDWRRRLDIPLMFLLGATSPQE